METQERTPSWGLTGRLGSYEWLSTQVKFSKFLLLDEYKNYKVPGTF